MMICSLTLFVHSIGLGLLDKQTFNVTLQIYYGFVTMLIQSYLMHVYVAVFYIRQF